MSRGSTRGSAEAERLASDARREANWKRWGPYLSERQWGTVREDYSAEGNAWSYFPHEHAPSRVYRWGEDGLLGICDRQCRLCFALGLHNGEDPILKERLFGLTGPQGNHGEDVKELYYYLDATPTASYLKALYKYPQRAYPYRELVEEARRRTKQDREHELLDTGVFDEDRYFDVTAEYAKASPNDILIRVRIRNHGRQEASVVVLGQCWFRNNWSWGRTGEGYGPRPRIERTAGGIVTEHETLGRFRLDAAPGPGGAPEILLTDNETNASRVFGSEQSPPHAKDAFHDYVVHGREEGLREEGAGTKAAALYRLTIPAGEEVVLRLRLREHDPIVDGDAFADFDEIVATRIAEADAFYAARTPSGLSDDERAVARQSYAGLVWTKQFYHYAVKEWLEGDPAQPSPPASRWRGRNASFTHLYNRDVISMPDKWEYPWYAAWDLAFHMIPMARIDDHFAKEQLILFLREWYLHPNGQIPAYEFAFDDVNPPVHAWAVPWQVYLAR